MNQKSYSKENRLKQLINYNSLSGNKANTFSINLNESDIHRYNKFKVCEELVKRGFEIYTEVIFKNGFRCDILAFDKESGEGHIFEIINSESDKSVSNKINNYYLDFELHFIYCDKLIDNQIEI